MQYRILGRTGLRVSDIGFGAMTIGGEVFGDTDDADLYEPCIGRLI